MSQSVSDPSEEQTVSNAEPLAAPVRKAHVRLSKVGVISSLVMIGLSLLLFSGQILFNVGQIWASTTPTPVLARQTQGSPSPQHSPDPASTKGQLTAPTPTATPAPVPPFFTPNNPSASTPTLQLPANHYVLYQNTTHIYLVSTTDGTLISLYTPNYTYNEAVRPVLTPGGQLIYSGDQSIWRTDIFDQQPVQIAQFTPDMGITSLALSQDGKMVAWSLSPLDGNGQISLYAGPLTNPQVVWQQSALQCHCFRIFSFLNGNTPAADTTLLLADDLGGSEAVQYGLWSLDISTSGTQPQAMMDENTQSQQGPLALAPYSNVLLYSPNEQVVPVPTDRSVPPDIAALSYANSLNLATLDGTPPTLGNPLQALPGQPQQANHALYRWITTPTFSPDGQTLAYIEFSSDSQAPYDRHSALYTISISGSGASLQVGQPHLVASSTTRLLELGPWLNSHIVTLYGDGSIYALDIQSGASTLIIPSGGYARVLAVVGTGQT